MQAFIAGLFHGTETIFDSRASPLKESFMAGSLSYLMPPSCLRLHVEPLQMAKRKAKRASKELPKPFKGKEKGRRRCFERPGRPRAPRGFRRDGRSPTRARVSSRFRSNRSIYRISIEGASEASLVDMISYGTV